eukprot:SAG31_NODE_351_length_17237_cov_7.010445_3_plen_57_part_00
MPMARTDSTTIAEDLHMVMDMVPLDVVQAAVRVREAIPAPTQRNRRVCCQQDVAAI